MASQVTNGKGFEWAVAQALASRLAIQLLRTAELQNAEGSYEKLTPAKQQHFSRCAEAAAKYIIEQEQLSSSSSRDVALLPDSSGARGDVRDVVVRLKAGGELGISCKTNHDAYKHSRLSASVDFIKKWGIGSGCSDEYWDAVRPLFSELKAIQVNSRRTATWESLGNYQEKFYVPVLEAWKNEIEKWTNGDNVKSYAASEALCRYILGTRDFWKVISYAEGVKLFAYNTGRSLRTEKTPVANRLIRVERQADSSNSLNVFMNNGYQFNFRIHNASSKVEPSLKFDIRSIGISDKVYQHWINF